MTPLSPPHPGGLERLLALVARLRSPEGCPWDREQHLPDLRAYLLEEAHETAAAIDGGDWSAIGEELGDLLFQVAFVTRLGEEEGALSSADVVAGVEAKMISRHPHVFGEESLADAEAVRRAWERRKLAEDRAGTSLLSGVPASLPALLAAYRMGQKAAGVGFDWSEPAAVLDKVREELAELTAAIEEPASASGEGAAEAVDEELGDLLFTLAHLARHLGRDPEALLAAANEKFRRRFALLETKLSERGGRLGDAGPEELERIWQEVKDAARGVTTGGAARHAEEDVQD